jgi:tetrahydromethanopterin S-methyltransferase subunit C
MIDSIPPQTAHAAGAASGITGLVIVFERIGTIFGALAAIAAFVGGSAYATYWCVKAYRKWKGTGE